MEPRAMSADKLPMIANRGHGPRLQNVRGDDLICVDPGSSVVK
jgi:hypothetical protein